MARSLRRRARLGHNEVSGVRPPVRTQPRSAATRLIVLFLSAGLAGVTVLSQTPGSTPREEDIPTPVPAETSLAGSTQPAIARFLNVRTATAPSLSPDGRQIAFRTSISGTPQLWVVGAEGGWPQQQTFGESVTFHEWSPAGDWIVYGTDRGGNEREGYS